MAERDIATSDEQQMGNSTEMHNRRLGKVISETSGREDNGSNLSQRVEDESGDKSRPNTEVNERNISQLVEDETGNKSRPNTEVDGRNLSQLVKGEGGDKSRPSTDSHHDKDSNAKSAKKEDLGKLIEGGSDKTRLVGKLVDSHHDKDSNAKSVKERDLGKLIKGGSDKERPQENLDEKESDTKAEDRETGQSVQDKQRNLKITFLKEKISALLYQSNYFEAMSLLEELKSLQKRKKLDTFLQMADCYLHLRREKKAYEAIETVRHIIVTSHALSADDVFSLSCHLCQNSSFIRAIILSRIASGLFKTHALSPDDVVNGIYKCIHKTFDATNSLIKNDGTLTTIGVDFGVEYMKEMYKDLSVVNNAEPNNKTLKQALSLCGIGVCYSVANEHEKRLKPQEDGIKLLESHFGSDASKYEVYGCLLHNTGYAYARFGKFSNAEKYYTKAIKAYAKTADFEHESKRLREIENSNSGLNNARAHLGKK